MQRKKNNLLKESKSNKKLYIWLFCLTILVFILGGFCLYNWHKISSGNLIVDFKSDEAYITIIITFTGFLAAFSAISIYSIFNASVDRERDEIATLRSESENDIKGLESTFEEHINVLKNKSEEHIKDLTNKLGSSNKELSEFLNNTKRLIDLTSPYSTTLKKIEAIKHFIVEPGVKEETQEFIYNFFISLGQEEKINRYYPELEKLLLNWGKIGTNGN
jgi:ABC-type multidrug transport system fused ATPase/permease subunit